MDLNHVAFRVSSHFSRTAATIPLPPSMTRALERFVDSVSGRIIIEFLDSIEIAPEVESTSKSLAALRRFAANLISGARPLDEIEISIDFREFDIHTLGLPWSAEWFEDLVLAVPDTAAVLAKIQTFYPDALESVAQHFIEEVPEIPILTVRNDDPGPGYRGLYIRPDQTIKIRFDSIESACADYIDPSNPRTFGACQYALEHDVLPSLRATALHELTHWVQDVFALFLNWHREFRSSNDSLIGPKQHQVTRFRDMGKSGSTNREAELLETTGQLDLLLDTSNCPYSVQNLSHTL